MAETSTAEIQSSLMDPQVQSCPWDLYRQLHQRCPVYRMPETGFFLVTRWDDCRTVLGDPETYSSKSNISKGLQAERSEQRRRLLAERGWSHHSTLHRTDPPEHTPARKILLPAFTRYRWKPEERAAETGAPAPV